jgi:cell division protein FtsL
MRARIIITVLIALLFPLIVSAARIDDLEMRVDDNEALIYETRQIAGEFGLTLRSYIDFFDEYMAESQVERENLLAELALLRTAIWILSAITILLACFLVYNSVRIRKLHSEIARLNTGTPQEDHGKPVNAKQQSESSTTSGASLNKTKNPDISQMFDGWDVEVLKDSYIEWYQITAYIKSILLEYPEMFKRDSDEAKEKGAFKPLDFEGKIANCNEITQRVLKERKGVVVLYDSGNLPKAYVYKLFSDLIYVLDKCVAMAKKYNEIQHRLVLKSVGQRYSFFSYQKQMKELDRMYKDIEVKARSIDVSYKTFCSGLNLALERMSEDSANYIEALSDMNAFKADSFSSSDAEQEKAHIKKRLTPMLYKIGIAIAAIAVVVLFLYMASITMLVEVYRTPDEVREYWGITNAGDDIYITLKPDNVMEVVTITLTDDDVYHTYYEYDIKGIYGNRVIGPLYYLDYRRGNLWPKFAKNGIRPIGMTMECIDSDAPHGNIEVGDTLYDVFWIADEWMSSKALGGVKLFNDEAFEEAD